MKSITLLVALWLWPASSPAFPAFRSLTMSPNEEKNLNHYVQVLENLMLSVPTKEPESASIVYSPDPAVSRLKALSTFGGAVPEDGALSSGHSTAVSATGPTLWAESRKPTESTAFWSIRPNNVSVVLHTKEPYIENEPEPEPEPVVKHTEAPRSSSFTIRSSTSPPVTAPASTDLEVSTESEDVPQLSGENLEEPVEHHSQVMNEEILREISAIHSQLQQAPLSDKNDPEYKEIIEGAKESLKRSLALAAAAEYRLEKMYESHVFPEGQTSKKTYDIETVINMLYNSRSKLSKYLDIKYVPPAMREKATIVFDTLKNILCVGQEDTENLIRKLINNIKGWGYSSVARRLPGKREVLSSIPVSKKTPKNKKQII